MEIQDDHLNYGRVLLQQGRYEEAETYFKQALANQPDNHEALAALSVSLVNQDNRLKDSLQAIDDAIALYADHAPYHIHRARILCLLKRPKEAHEILDVALAIDPEDVESYVIKTHAYLVQERWADAETWAKKALVLDADNSLAKNFLAMALGYQNKMAESQIEVESLLRDDPESPAAHFNAGWAALRRHDHKLAETHFLETLRLDPRFDGARESLLESFRARSWLYRLYLRYTFFMQRFTSGVRFALIIGLYVGIQFGRKLLNAVHPLAAGALSLVYMLVVFWVWLAPGVGNFLVTLDRRARYALERKEVVEGILVGGGLLLGVASAATAYFAGMPAFGFLGGALILGALPASLTFTNDSPAGRKVFGLLTGLAYGAGLIGFVSSLLIYPSKELHGGVVLLMLLALVGCVLSTWLGNIPALRQEPPR